MEVRRIRPQEWAQLRDVRLRALEDAPDSFGSTLAETRLRDDDHWRAWADSAGSSAEAAVFVAVEEGRFAGLCGSFLHGDDPRIGHIVAMWVAPESRGRALGGELLDAASRWSAAQGALELVLDVTETNEAARRLYRRSGFSETGETASLRSNPSLITVQMRKPLVRLGHTSRSEQPGRMERGRRRPAA